MVTYDKSRIGILPQLCITFLNKRKELRAEMDTVARDTLEYKILNAKQLHMKLMANTLYGS